MMAARGLWARLRAGDLLHPWKRSVRRASAVEQLNSGLRFQARRYLAASGDRAAAFESRERIIERGGVLVRDFIHDSLYNRTYGYFANAGVVGTLRAPINFQSLRGEQDYRLLLQSLYKESDVSWFTPSELFQPWYGRAIASLMLRHCANLKQQAPLQVFEVGAGAGTAALSVLDLIKEQAPSVYDGCSYRTLEISPSLAARQQQRVALDGGHGGVFSATVCDAASPAAWGEPSEEPCFVLLLEVLDNLPHDRVSRTFLSDYEWAETWVTPAHRLYHSRQGPAAAQRGAPTGGGAPAHQLASASGQQPFIEELQPMEDNVVTACFRAYQHEGAAHGASGSSPVAAVASLLRRLAPPEPIVWLPTTCLMLLRTIYSARPNATVIAADFSSLPDVTIPGRCAPLVSGKADGVTTDYPTYLVEKGKADIFFPTDFSLLRSIDHVAAAAAMMNADTKAASDISYSSLRKNWVEPSSTFLRSISINTTTKSSFNPLLHDFHNTSFFLSCPISHK